MKGHYLNECYRGATKVFENPIQTILLCMECGQWMVRMTKSKQIYRVDLETIRMYPTSENPQWIRYYKMSELYKETFSGT